MRPYESCHGNLNLGDSRIRNVRDIDKLSLGTDVVNKIYIDSNFFTLVDGKINSEIDINNKSAINLKTPDNDEKNNAVNIQFVDDKM